MRKASVLFEVALAAMLVAVISVFVFRGYSVFSRAEKRSLEYLRLVSLAEEKFWQLRVKEKSGDLRLDIPVSGKFGDSPYFWDLAIEDGLARNLKKIALTVTKKGKKSLSFDLIGYFYFSGEE